MLHKEMGAWGSSGLLKTWPPAPPPKPPDKGTLWVVWDGERDGLAQSTLGAWGSSQYSLSSPGLTGGSSIESPKCLEFHPGSPDRRRRFGGLSGDDEWGEMASAGWAHIPSRTHPSTPVRFQVVPRGRAALALRITQSGRSAQFLSASINLDNPILWRQVSRRPGKLVSRMRRVLFTIVTLGLASCTSSFEPIDADRVFGGEAPSFWQVQSLNAKPVMRDTILHVESGSVKLDVPDFATSWAGTFENETLSLLTNHSERWTFEIDNPEVDTPPEIETFNDFAKRIASASVSDEQLQLYGKNGDLLLEATRIRSKGIENEAWRIDAFVVGDTLTPTTDLFSNRFLPELVLMHGSLSGSIVCSAVTGSYERDLDQVKIFAVPVLFRNCPEHIKENGLALLSAIQGVSVFQRKRRVGYLKDEDGETAAVLTAISLR